MPARSRVPTPVRARGVIGTVLLAVALPSLLMSAAACAVQAPAEQSAAAMSAAADPVVRTEHHIRVNGKTLAYTAETGRVAIRDVATGAPHGYMFYIAYRVKAEGKPRPLAFVWNGGPGANSALLHFEAAGPRRLHNGALTDNEDTWLTATDLVFVDPVGTGFSRPVMTEYADEFYGTLGDVASVTEFVRAWRLLHAAEGQPVLLAGESWGAGRAGSVGYRLLEQGLPLRALVLISGGAGLNRDVISPALAQALRAVDRSTTALYHKKLAPDLGDSAADIRAQAETWVREVYAPALAHVDGLSNAERDAVVQGLSRYTGMPPALIDRESLAISPRAYREGLLAASGKTLDVFNMRIVHDNGAGVEPGAESGRRQAIVSYLRHDLGYRTALPYVGTEHLQDGYAPNGKYPASVNLRWNYATAELSPEEVKAAIDKAVKRGGGPPQLGPPLPSAADAVDLDPDLKVLVAAGRYDSLNSCAANAAVEEHLEGALKKAYTFRCYQGGHTMYRDETARHRLARDVRALAAAVR